MRAREFQLVKPCLVKVMYFCLHFSAPPLRFLAWFSIVILLPVLPMASPLLRGCAAVVDFQVMLFEILVPSGDAAVLSAPIVPAAMGIPSPLKSKTQPVSWLRTLPLTFGHFDSSTNASSWLDVRWFAVLKVNGKSKG